MINIQGGRLYQWDIDREVIIKPRTEINEVHLAHPNDAEALVLKVNILEKGIYSANIPNILLQSSENIVIYAVNNNVTVEKCTVNVIDREKPADYVYTETEVKRWEDLEKKVIEGIGYYKPIVDENGNLNWQASNKKFPTIEPINIKGDKGDKGAQGIQGVKGNKGEDGYTPQKGVDYFTPEDITGLNIPSVDQTYSPTSENAQSGKAVAEAIAQNTYTKISKIEISVDDFSQFDTSKVYIAANDIQVKYKKTSTAEFTTIDESTIYKNSLITFSSWIDTEYSTPEFLIIVSGRIISDNFVYCDAKYRFEIDDEVEGERFLAYKPLYFNPSPTDLRYFATSDNPQSGKAVAEAVSAEQKRADNTFSNALKGSKSGSAIIIDDISPVPHEMSVKISSDTVTDLTAVRLIKENGSGKIISEHTPNADGTVYGVTNLYPNTTLTTDTDGVIIECEYNKDINIVLKHININTWKDVQDTVRAGLGHIRFPVGYEFTTEDSVTGAVITWVVRGHNHHAAANKKLKYTMTLEAKYVYGSASGTYKTLVFDAPEALYYAAEELPAGTYNFTLLAGYDTTYGGGKTLSFTLTKPVPAGGVIMFPWAYSKQSTVTKISTYASNAATAAIESVAVIEAADGTSLGTADGKSENVNHTHRIRYGSNNYAQSAARQWLNSDAAAGAVWAPSNIFDRPPFWNTIYSGFMRGLPVDFLAAVQPAIVPCRTNSIAEVNSLDGTEFVINQVYELQDKFFLLSRPEIYGTWSSSTYKDGELLEFYEGFTDTERIKYDAAGSARHCWLRSPQPGYANYEHLVNTSGAFTNSYTDYASGVAPACIIA